MSPKVSVLMTVYNTPEYIEQAIHSVLDQSFADWELCIVDDGSTDSFAFAHGHTASLRDKRVVYHRFDPTPEERAATVRYATLLNWGAAHTSGEYVTFLCGDDFYLLDRLERMLAVLEPEGFPLCEVAYGAQRLLYEDGHEAMRGTCGVLVDPYHRVDLNSVTVSRHAFDRAGGFPDTPATPQMWREADAHFWRRLTGAGFRFVPVPGGPTDCKRYRAEGVDERVKAGLTPWV